MEQENPYFLPQNLQPLLHFIHAPLLSPITVKEGWFPQYLATQVLYVCGISGSKPRLALVSLQMHFIYSFWNTFATCTLPRKFLSFQLKYYFLWFDYTSNHWSKVSPIQNFTTELSTMMGMFHICTIQQGGC